VQRLLVIGAGGPMREGLFLAAARRGISVTLVDDNPYNRYDRLVDTTILRRPDDPALVTDLAAVARRADGITSLSDRAAPLVDQVARAHGFPAPGCGAARSAHDKALLRRLTNGRLRPVRSALVHDEQVIDRFFAEWRGPAIIKPVDGAASFGVVYAESAREAHAGLEHAVHRSRRGLAVIEGYVPGPEFSFEVVVRDRAVWSLSVTEKTTTGPPHFLERQQVSENDQSRYERLGAQAFAATLVESLGVENAVMHVETKLADGGWTLIEAAVRPGGGMIAEVTGLGGGLDLYDSQLAVALGLTPGTRDVAGPVSAVRFVIGRGTIRDPRSLTEIAEGLDSVLHVCTLLPAGFRVGELEANWQRAAYVLARGADRTQVLAEVAEAERRLTGALGLTDAEDRRVA